MDLDGLKKINDALPGHVVGSPSHLPRGGNVLRAQCRSLDIAARYGGDEFAVILPETCADDAKHLASRIASAVRRDQEERLRYSVSFTGLPHARTMAAVSRKSCGLRIAVLYLDEGKAVSGNPSFGIYDLRRLMLKVCRGSGLDGNSIGPVSGSARRLYLRAWSNISRTFRASTFGSYGFCSIAAPFAISGPSPAAESE